MRVAIISKALVTAAYRQKLAELARLGIEVTAVAPPAWREGGSVQQLEPGDDRGYDLRVLPLRLNGHFHLHHYPDLPRLLRQVRPDVVHMDEEPYNLATYHALRAARRLGMPSLFFSWQNLERAYPPPFSWMERSVYGLARAGIAGSEAVAQVLRHKGFAGRLAVIPQFGVDPEVFFPGSVPHQGFRVGFLNRLVPGKAPLLMLEAFARLPVDAELEVVGDGPLRGQVEQAVAAGGLSGRVGLRGRVPSLQVPEIMRSLDVVVLPSVTTGAWQEQFGRVLIEAMACGVPVIGSDSGEIPRVVGDAGLIVPEGEAEALTAALQRLMASAELRRDLGQRGRARVLAHFSHAAVAHASAELYRTLTG